MNLNWGGQSFGRNHGYDAVAGILMIVVIMLHGGVLKSTPLSIMHFFNFFMPWFFFKAGLFHKETEKNTKATLWKYTKRYIVPMFFCSLTSACLLVVLHPDKINEISSLRDLLLFIYDSNGVIWFLIALVSSKVIFNFCSKDRIWLLLTIAFTFVLSNYINVNPFPIRIEMKEIPMALFYYACGYSMKSIVNKLFLFKEIIAMLVVYSLYLVLEPSKVDMRMEQVMFGAFAIAVLGNIVGIVFINAFICKIQKYIPNFLIYVGKESMAYYILHMQLLRILGHFLDGYPHARLIFCVKLIVILCFVPLVMMLLKKVKMQFLLGK